MNCKIVRDGKPGKPDIYIIDEEYNNMFIFSLKNLELNENPYCVIVEELKPELEFAYYNYTFETYDNVILYLIVFDSLTEEIYVEKIDFKNPTNVNIYN